MDGNADSCLQQPCTCYCYIRQCVSYAYKNDCFLSDVVNKGNEASLIYVYIKINKYGQGRKTETGESPDQKPIIYVRGSSAHAPDFARPTSVWCVEK